MPATFETRELFAKATSALADVQAEQDMRIKAGAITSVIDSASDPDNYILITTWNVIGENG